MRSGGLEHIERADRVGPEGGGVVVLGWRGQHAAEVVDRVGPAGRHCRVDLGGLAQVAAYDVYRVGDVAQPLGRRVEVEQA